VAAAVLAEPFVSRLVAEGKAKVAVDLRTAAAAAPQRASQPVR